MTHKQEADSIPQSQELLDSWDLQLKALDDRLRASGLTVTVTEGLGGDELTASIPQGKKPSSNQQDWPTTAEIEAAVKRVEEFHHGTAKE